jgi:DNA-binding HxlR family transcriptional regulator
VWWVYTRRTVNLSGEFPRELGSGMSRPYGTPKREVLRISERALIRQMKELETDRVITHEDYGGVPPRVEHSLSDHSEA